MKRNPLKKYIFQNPHLIVCSVILILLASALAELTPYIQGLIAKNVVISENEQKIFWLAIVFIIALVLDAFAKTYLSLVSTKIGYTVANKVRGDFFSEIINQPYTFFTHQRNGEVIQRANSFVYAIGAYLATSVNNLAIGTIRFLIIFVFMFVLSYKLAFLLAILYAVIYLIILIISHVNHKLGEKYKRFQLHRNSLILQNVENIETYLAYNDDFTYLKNYTRVNKAYGKARRKYFYIQHLINPIIDFLASLGTVVIYQYALSGGLNIFEVAVVVAMLTYVSRIITPIQLIADGIRETIQVDSTIEKVFKFVSPPKNTGHEKFKDQQIDIKCTSIAYSDSYTGENFKNINLEIPFGQKVAIYGRYGLGKTEFSEILMGLYPPLNGKVLFNNTDIQTISSQDIKNSISLASDYVGIFSGSVLENIRFAKPEASDKAVRLAIQQSGLDTFVNSLAKKEKTIINNKIVSEGDKQLFAFARLILRNTPIVIFDEFARDLDNNEKKKFYPKLTKFTKNKTLIYICQTIPKELQFDKLVNFAKYSK